MKKILISFFAIVLMMPLGAQSQDAPKQREIGLIFTGLNSFGLTYRQGKAEALWRFRVANVSGGSDNSVGDSLSNRSQRFAADLMAGKEFRKTLDEHFTFRYGLDLGLGLRLNEANNENMFVNGSDQSTNASQLFTASMNLVLGFNYQLSDKFILGAEVLPSFGYTFGQQEFTYITSNRGARTNVQDVSDWSYQMRLSSILLSAVYVF
tara:strand:+ start:52166 stop:52789 length:624 start_codon:yes stop_codon:yes gene_type:complete